MRRAGVAGPAADDRDVADGRVPLRELGHDRGQHIQDALRQNRLLVRGDGLGLGLDRLGTGLTLSADGIGLGFCPEATCRRLRIRERA